MSRHRPVDNSATVSLFPFLAVLLCTMGALLVVLVAVSRSARETALRRAEAAEAAPEERVQLGCAEEVTVARGPNRARGVVAQAGLVQRALHEAGEGDRAARRDLRADPRLEALIRTLEQTRAELLARTGRGLWAVRQGEPTADRWRRPHAHEQFLILKTFLHLVCKRRGVLPYPSLILYQ